MRLDRGAGAANAIPHSRDGGDEIAALPIVDDEGSDFLCRRRQTLARLIETRPRGRGSGRWLGGSGLQLLTFHGV